MKEVRVQDAIGMVLAHDLTRIVPGEFKGRVFQKGHVITEEDIPVLLDIGKEHIYILELKAGQIHENDAAIRMSQALMGENMVASEPHEGKIVFRPTVKGLYKVNEEGLFEINSIPEIAVASKKSNTVVRPDETLVGMRAIPLVIAEEKVAQVEAIAKRYREQGGILQVKPFLPLRVGIVTTGSEVFTGRIEDKFGPAVRAKVAAFGSEMVEQRIVGDNQADIVAAIREFLQAGMDLILCTGGMSVDPDDRTPAAIAAVATEVVTYGMPILPGSMTMLAYAGKTPIFGLPGAVMFDPVTAFDLILPRVWVGETVTRAEIARLGSGGLLK